MEEREQNTNGKKVVSEKQLAANRRNAQNSTGPRTPEGKKRSSKNALRHGALSQDVVITVGDAAESPEEYEAFRDAVLAGVHDDDPLEIMLAMEVVNDAWRQRRCRRAENGLIRARGQGAAERALRSIHAQAPKQRNPWASGELEEKLPPNPRDLASLIGRLKGARQEVGTRGHIIRETFEELRRTFRAAGADIEPIRELNKSASYAAWHAKQQNDSDPEAAKLEEYRAELLAALDQEMHALEAQKAELEKGERLVAEAMAEAEFVPAEDWMEVIARYETTIARRKARAIDQLVRLRDQRRGPGQAAAEE